MAETATLKLPLVQAAQAQKHVTVNEAFGRLDAMAQLVLASRAVGAPPTVAAEGSVYALPPDATGVWAGQGGRLALRLNGGWEFVSPVAGWRAWIADEGALALFDGSGWVADAVAVSPGGAGLGLRVVEIDHVVSVGGASTTVNVIPEGAIVFGVTGRVLVELGGTAMAFRVGIDGVSADRYGSGIGTGAGAWFRGITGTPLAYYADTALTLTAEGGAFGGGVVRIAVHFAELGLPSA
jgi:hypothetical protein